MVANKRFGIGILALFAAGLLLASGPTAHAQSNSNIFITDKFGRNLDRQGITLVDWDGYMANPAIKIFLNPDASMALPVEIWLKTNDPLVYFDLPSMTDATGSRKYFKEEGIGSAHPIPVLVSTAPSRNGHATSDLKITIVDAEHKTYVSHVPIHVIDFHSSYGPPRENYISVDFSPDKTHFFDVPANREALIQAAADWNYYIDASDLDVVPSGDETTLIWSPEGFVHPTFTKNMTPYKGYKLYAYGIHIAQMRSGSEGSYRGGLQHSKGNEIPLRRSGGIEIETQGNYNTLGWTTNTDSQSWWIQTGRSPGELFSIAHHEMGHSIAFNGAHPKFKQYSDRGMIDDPDVVAYYGSPIAIDQHDHFNGVVDPDSGKGAFGYDWHGLMPSHRWLITKLDLLALKACGFKLRPTAALTPLTFDKPNIPAAVAGQAYSCRLTAHGGIPIYNWTVSNGGLPPGMELDPFSGSLRGTPISVGTYRFTARVQDYHPVHYLEQPIELVVAPGAQKPGLTVSGNK